MPELLLELLSEEIPARMQARAAADLGRLVHERCGELLRGEARCFVGPRRLGLVAEVVSEMITPARAERGPRVGAGDAAIAGFLRKFGYSAAAGQAMLRQENGYWVLHCPERRVRAAELLAAVLPGLIRSFPWPKSMRWGAGSSLGWIRPLRRILCLLDGQVVPFTLATREDDGNGLVAGNMTEGHRLMAPGAFSVRSFADFAAGLRARKVVLAAEERCALIRQGLARVAAAQGLLIEEDEGLIAEVAGLVEWPVPLLGRIDAAFMDLPPEVRRTAMRVHQRFFALAKADGTPAPFFAMIANVEAADGGAAIIAGNERVLRARLADARFFWDLDRRQPLEAFLPRLQAVIFHAKLGSQGARVRRLEALARLIAPAVGADTAQTARAAHLAKADLASGMVGEFPELQGIMGRYYALQAGEDAVVAEAIAAHYRPHGAADAIPHHPVAIAVALADRLDQLVGFFAIGEKPTGSGDPFALRRAALGVIRIIREAGLRLALIPLLERAAAALLPDIKAATGSAPPEVKRPFGREGRRVSAFALEVLEFLLERLRVQLRSEGLRHDVVSAVLGAAADDDINRILRRADAVLAFLATTAGADLLMAYRRAVNILRIEEKRDGHPFDTGYERHLLKLREEEALAEVLEQTARRMAFALEAEDFVAAMAALAGLRAAVDAFFDHVIVNDTVPELRRNRLKLLARLRAVMDTVADFAQIEG